MKERLKVGIAGYGTVGKIRRQFIDEHPNLEVIAVCDQRFTPERFDPKEIRAWTRYQELLSEPLDVLFVCLPNYLAPEVTIAGLERGLHVFCEKPPGREVADLRRVMAIEREHPNQKLMYGFNHRYHESVKEALRIISEGTLGEIINLNGVYGKSKIIRFDSDWRTQRALAGGGILLDQGIHLLDLMRLFAGEFTEVHSFISNGFWHHDVEDNAYVLMRSKRGIVAMLHSSATLWRHRFRLEITLTKGAILLSGILSSTKSYGAETITTILAGKDNDGNPAEKTIRYDEDISWRNEIFDFAEAILQNHRVAHGSSSEALKTLQLVERIYASDTEWSKIYPVSLPPRDLSLSYE